MKPVVISRPDFFPDEANFFYKLFDAGLEVLHLRKPGGTKKQIRRLLAALPTSLCRRVVLHQSHELFMEFELFGLHGPVVRNKIPENLQRSKSCHLLDELKAVGPEFAYVFLSPVFNSISKPGYAAAFEHGKIKAALKRIMQNKRRLKIIALGGISPNNAVEARDMGFDGVASLGGIWHGDEPAKAYRDLSEAWQ